MKYLRSLLIAFVIALSVTPLLWGADEIKGTSFFNQTWLKTLISIEVSADGKTSVPIGSGFLVQTPGNHIALITAKHVVFDENGKQRDKLAYRFNQKNSSSELLTEANVLNLAPGGWFKSAEADVACRLIAWPKQSDLIAIPYSQFLTKDRIEPGAPIFVIGFPMGLRSEDHATPILRNGIVARTEPNNILIDAFVFPGNSGGPVVYSPSIPLAEGGIIQSPLLQGQWLIGLAISYVPYLDVAISAQTKRPRISFEENSGLCNVVPASVIIKLLQSKGFVAVDVTK